MENVINYFVLFFFGNFINYERIDFKIMVLLEYYCVFFIGFVMFIVVNYIERVYKINVKYLEK